MSKVAGIFVLMLFVAPALPIGSSIDKNNFNLVSDDVSVDENCGYGVTSRINTKHAMMNEISKLLDLDDSFPISKIFHTPDYFCWLDYNGEDWTTPAKDQGNCGSCWLYAALGTLECVIKIRESCPGLELDLSEQYVLSCLPRAGSCEGGLAYRAFKYIMSNTTTGNYCNGIIPEFCFSYQANDTVSCSNKCSDWEKLLIPISDFGHEDYGGSAEDREAIKTHIMEIGPVAAAMLFTYYIHGENNLEEWGWLHHDPSEYYPYPGPFDNSNHQVVIVGWKDDLSIRNGGYWIVKNSFSEEWGYDGFFNIEYGSLNIEKYIDWVDYNPETYDNWMPVANANGMYYYDVDQEIIFDASGSFDHEGDIISYHWDFGDGTSENGISVKKTYSQKGIYPITLTVIDDLGNAAEDKTWAFIGKSNEPPPTPTLTGETRGRNGTAYTYSFSSSDPDGDDIYYYVVWGDTYWEGRWDSWIGPYPSDEKVTLENIWEENGNYTVRVKAKDKYESKSDWATLSVSMAKNKATNLELLQFLGKFPLYFPLFIILLNILDLS